MSRRSRPGILRCAGIALLLAAFAPQAAGAAAGTGSVTMVGETGDYVSGGQAHLFDPSVGSVTLGGTPAHATVAVSGGVDNFTFDFAPPAGQTLGPGLYTGAERYPFQAAGAPAIDVSGDGRGCNQEYGTFLVKDVHADAAGNLDRLWVLYEDHCESPTAPAVFGEVRLGEPPAGSAAGAEPTGVRWPNADLGRPQTVVPVTLIAGSGGGHVDSVALAGADPGDFAVRLDGCSGQSLAPGGRCQVFLRFAPTTTGARAADLRVSASGVLVDVPLSGFVYAGTTRVDLQSDPGDYIGGGVYGFYSNANARIAATGTRQHVTVQLTGDDGSYITADFSPASGDILAPGTTYSPVARDPFRGNLAGLDVYGNGRGCNTLTGQFTVLDANFDPGGSLLDFGASFVQHCEGGGPALRGTVQFRSPTAATLLAVDAAPPAVMGAPLVGRTLTAWPGRWKDPSTAYAYQWQRCSGGACSDVPGATLANYAVGSADLGWQLAVEVNLTNPAGRSSWIRSAVTVPVDEGPSAAYAPSTYTPVEGQTASFDAGASADPDGSIVSYRWVWGDQTPDGSGPAAKHVFTTPGLRSVGLYVTDSDGHTTAVGHGITVVDERPTAAYTPSTYRPRVGQTVTFPASASDPDGSVVSYRWVWDDGTPDGSGPTATHAFTTTGVHSVGLYVTDSAGRTAAVGHGITVSA